MDDRVVARVCDPAIGCIEIISEENCYENPIEEWDHLVSVVMSPKLDGMGTDPNTTTERFTYEDIDRMRKWNDEGGCFVPIIVYDHGGLHFSLSRCYPFNDPWDSYTGGFMYIDPDETRKLWPLLDTKDRHQAAMRACESMIKLMNAYASGDCYGYSIYGPDMEHVDSCGGFWNTYDTEEELIKDMASSFPSEFQDLAKRLEMGSLDKLEVIIIRRIPS